VVNWQYRRDASLLHAVASAHLTASSGGARTAEEVPRRDKMQRENGSSSAYGSEPAGWCDLSRRPRVRRLNVSRLGDRVSGAFGMPHTATFTISPPWLSQRTSAYWIAGYSTTSSSLAAKHGQCAVPPFGRPLVNNTRRVSGRTWYGGPWRHAAEVVLIRAAVFCAPSVHYSGRAVSRPGGFIPSINRTLHTQPRSPAEKMADAVASKGQDPWSSACRIGRRYVTPAQNFSPKVLHASATETARHVPRLNVCCTSRPCVYVCGRVCASSRARSVKENVRVLFGATCKECTHRML
jgi:hypothetical protein